MENGMKIYSAMMLMRRKLHLVMLMSMLHLENTKGVQQDINIKQQGCCCLRVTRRVPSVKQ